MNKEVEISLKDVVLHGDISIPDNATGIVLFCHGSGSNRHSPRNKYVAKKLHKRGFGTFLFDLLTPEENKSFNTRFDVELLTKRLTLVTDWFVENVSNSYPIGYFGASTGAAAALWAAANLGNRITAVVSRGGRPDLALPVLLDITACTLLIVGSFDYYVLSYNEQAYEMLNCKKDLKIVEDASHLFEEPGKLEEVAELTVNWFTKHLHTREIFV